jgi:hypothetical protein
VSALIPLACVAAYTALTLAAARWRFRAIRPYTEPLSCTTPLSCRDGDHYDSCYRRRRGSMISTTGEGVVFALLTGLAWPLILPAMAVSRIVSAGPRVLPEELAAQIKRLEAENERLKLEQAKARR